ncbi:MAG: tRNA (N6-isopentenyl adenosine(37)-C2)-methylthiotransferase MiaB, partial [Fidelibacterota bacterium]
MKYYLRTYGCQMNVYDSELVMGILNGEGHIRTSMLDEADIIIINTCSVRQNAENRVLNKLDQLKHLKVKNPQLIVGVIGCVAQNLKKAIIENRQFINFVLGPDSYRKIPEIIKNLKSSESAFVEVGLSRSETYDYLYPARGESVNAWIAIMRGCNRFCSFCIVPYLRGRERSKPAARVLDEVKRAANEGYAEITLLGQNVNAYRDGRVDFPDLLKMIEDVDGIKRIRFTSPHPQDMSLKLIKTIAEVSKICNHIHLPVQAGSDKILSLMNRNYSRDEYISLVDRIRSFISGVSITTDIIAGFPGET